MAKNFDRVMKSKNLGSGLLSENSRQFAVNEFKVTYIPLEQLVSNPRNEGFTMDDIEELKTSIREVGLEQNLVVVPDGAKFRILTGHRRYLALKALFDEGLEKFRTVPCIVKDLSKIDLPLSEDSKELYAIATTNLENRRCSDADKLKLMAMLSQVYDELKANGYDRLGKRRDFLADRLGISSAGVQILSYVDKNIAEPFRAAQRIAAPPEPQSQCERCACVRAAACRRRRARRRERSGCRAAQAAHRAKIGACGRRNGRAGNHFGQFLCAAGNGAGQRGGQMPRAAAGFDERFGAAVQAPIRADRPAARRRADSAKISARGIGAAIKGANISTFSGRHFSRETFREGRGMSKTATNCDMCANYEYNEETGYYECNIALDEDEMVRFLNGDFRECPYFSLEGEYRTVRKQN